MALSNGLVRRLLIALGARREANEVIDILNKASANGIEAVVDVALITATAVSTTTDFAALAVGDKVIHIPASAGNSNFLTVAVAGTLPAAAVIGDLYIVKRAVPAQVASNAKL